MIKFLKYITKLAFFGCISGIILGCVILFIYIKNLPDIYKINEHKPDLVSKIYSEDNQLLEEYAEEYRLFTPMEKIPPHVVTAFLAAEDADYFEHAGIDPLGIGRALITNLENLKSGKSLVGGSTITQQVVKNLLLTNEKSIERKIKEAILSIRLDAAFSKEKILELYLNYIFLGNRSYGIASAAANYFNKDLKDISISEAALLASLPKAPSYYNPKRNLIRATQRKNWVLKQMLDKHFITQQQYDQAITEEIKLTKNNRPVYSAPYFSNEVHNFVSQKYGPRSIFKDGLIINTTIIPPLQTHASKALREGIDKVTKLISSGDREITSNDKINGAMIVINNNSGKVVALVGGYDFDQSQFNRATQSIRQSGSTFKPFVYLAALEEGYSPAYIIEDMPTIISQGKNLDDWMPKNYADDFLGNITLRRSLELSRNVATVKLARNIGIKRISDIAEKLGVIKGPITNLSSVLGATDTKLIDIAAGYATIVNGGKKITPVLIENIQDRYGKIIYQNPNLKCINCHNIKSYPKILDLKKRVVSKESAFQLTNILKGATKRGTSRKAASLKMNIGGKTGTTNDNKDCWFVGFTPDYTVAIYLGYDTPRSMGRKAIGATTALPIFIEFIESTKWFFRDRPFNTPNSIRMIKIDPYDGTRANPNTIHPIFEAFKNNQYPNVQKNTTQSSEIELELDSEVIY